MIITSTLHNHCTMCDGKSTADEMILAAIDAHFSDFGMSCHGYAPFDPDYSIPGEEEYVRTMSELKEKYSGRMRVWTGIEEDLFAPNSGRVQYDYIIGDVHYAKSRHTGELFIIDGSPESFAEAKDRAFGGNAMDLVKDYYENMVHAASKKPDILGHFDLIVKTNTDNMFFDEESEEYTDTALQALKACNEYGVIFEVNTGAVVRRRRTLPYPAPFLLKKLCDMGGKVTLSADCHDARTLTGELELGMQVIRAAGFKSIYVWENGNFVSKEI